MKILFLICLVVSLFCGANYGYAAPEISNLTVQVNNEVSVKLKNIRGVSAVRVNLKVFRNGKFRPFGKYNLTVAKRTVKLPALPEGRYRLRVKSCVLEMCTASSNKQDFIVTANVGEGGPTPSPSPTATISPTPTSPFIPPPVGPTPGVTPTPSEPPPPPVGQIQQITYQGFTITLAAPRPYGYFVTGEPWVVGPATITSISPTPVYGFFPGNNTCVQNPTEFATYCTEMPGTTPNCNSSKKCEYKTTRNGVQVNPMPGGQAFDGRGSAYVHSTRAELPIVLPGNTISSVVLSSSNPETTNCSICAWCSPGWTDYRGGCNWSPINGGVVFTALPSPAYADELRPPYVGSLNKKRYRTNNLNTNFLSLTPAPGAPSFNSVLDTVKRTWFMHVGAESYTLSSPNQNMASYGSLVTRDFGIAALSLVRSDLTAEQKRQIALHLAQIGVDAAHSLWNGVQWGGSGGHSGYGRTLSAVVAGALLNDPDLLNITNEQSVRDRTAQIFRTYYDYPTYVDSLGVTRANPYYFGTNGFPRMFPHGAWPVHNTQEHNSFGDIDKNGDYFKCCSVSAWVAEVLAVRLLGLEAYVNAPALFDVIDRVMMEGTEAGAHISEWANAMWQLYPGNPSIRPILCLNGALNRCLVNCNDKQTPIQFSGETGIDCGNGCQSPNNVCPP